MSPIAVVEDNPDNRLLLQAILADRFELDEYDNGPAALAGLREHLPGMVLLDISLPGRDGLEVLRRMKDDAVLRHVPVVALTAHAMSGDRERFLSAGFDGYVTKPIVDENVLFAAIEQALRP